MKKAAVVDLGCGEPDRHISNTVGVDCDPVCEPDVECSLFEGLPFDDESVDVVTAFASFRYLFGSAEELAARLKEVARVLRPGGLFVVFDHYEIWDWEEEDFRSASAEEVENLWHAAVEKVVSEGVELELDFDAFPPRPSFTYGLTMRKKSSVCTNVE